MAVIDTAELQALARDLRAAGADIHEAVRPVFQRGALQIKRQMVAEMSSSTHFKQLASSISYETRENLSGVTAEIGPEKGRAGGALANVAYFGTSRGGGTVPDPVGALNAEAPRLEQAIGDALRNLL